MNPQYDVKELELIFELCRKHGVTQLLVKGLEVHFTPTTVAAKTTNWQLTSDTGLLASVPESIPTEGLPTEDDLLNWSNGLPLPSELTAVEGEE